MCRVHRDRSWNRQLVLYPTRRVTQWGLCVLSTGLVQSRPGVCIGWILCPIWCSRLPSAFMLPERLTGEGGERSHDRPHLAALQLRLLCLPCPWKQVQLCLCLSNLLFVWLDSVSVEDLEASSPTSWNFWIKSKGNRKDLRVVTATSLHVNLQPWMSVCPLFYSWCWFCVASWINVDHSPGCGWRPDDCFLWLKTIQRRIFVNATDKY